MRCWRVGGVVEFWLLTMQWRASRAARMTRCGVEWDRLSAERIEAQGPNVVIRATLPEGSGAAQDFRQDELNTAKKQSGGSFQSRPRIFDVTVIFPGGRGGRIGRRP